MDLAMNAIKQMERRRNSMKKEQGFSLIELLIVVAIIAIIAAIAVPSMLTARMAANEAGAVQSLRTYGSAQTAFAATNNQLYGTLAQLTDVVNGGYLDNRWDPAGTLTFNGYLYAVDQAIAGAPGAAAAAVPDGFGCTGTPKTADSTGRYQYGIASDQVVRFLAVSGGANAPKCGAADCVAGDPIGKQ
jgi:prepilin-type N-terminal cleavage/methylation domain-containing protein